MSGGGKLAITGEKRKNIIDIITKADKEGYVDYITLSASLLFSGKYAKNYHEFIKQGFYNRVKKTEYNADGYLEGVERRHCDYKELFEEFKGEKNVCFILDPPYLATDCSSYTSCWKLRDYLDVLLCLQDTSFIYFTSNKTSIVELCQWLGLHKDLGNPLEDAQKREVFVGVNKSAKYRDMMFFRK